MIHLFYLPIPIVPLVFIRCILCRLFSSLFTHRLSSIIFNSPLSVFSRAFYGTVIIFPSRSLFTVPLRDTSVISLYFRSLSLFFSVFGIGNSPGTAR